MKQTERILQAMRANPDGVCSTMMVNEYIMRPAARIGELKAQGHNIVTVECPYFHHGHPTNVATYKLMPHNVEPIEARNETTPPVFDRDKPLDALDLWGDSVRA